jgi:uncharacterized Tic20 family protein
MLPTTKDDRTWAMLCHIAGLAGYVIPLGNIFGTIDYLDDQEGPVVVCKRSG